jgi:hypothetical protein
MICGLCRVALLAGYPPSISDLVWLICEFFRCRIRCREKWSDIKKLISDLYENREMSFSNLINLPSTNIYCNSSLLNHELIKLNRFILQSYYNVCN